MNYVNNIKSIQTQNQWHEVLKELDNEQIKLYSYDLVLLNELGEIAGKSILDYGAGPGVLALELAKHGAEVKVYDINPEMRRQAGIKIGNSNVYENTFEIPEKKFDVVICNLVLCIVDESEVCRILRNIKRVLKPEGVAYVGFCNPKIHNVAESQLDFRFFSGKGYFENHNYKKVKKEGIYEIVENHRPVDWYARVFAECQLLVCDILRTPEYELRDQRISDFVIFKLK